MHRDCAREHGLRCIAPFLSHSREDVEAFRKRVGMRRIALEELGP